MIFIPLKFRLKALKNNLFSRSVNNSLLNTKTFNINVFAVNNMSNLVKQLHVTKKSDISEIQNVFIFLYLVLLLLLLVPLLLLLLLI